MSIGSIASTVFSLNPLSKEAYTFEIQFLDQGEVPLSKKQFIFTQKSVPQEGEVWDVHSQNGICTPALLKDLFHQKDAKALAAILGKLPLTQSKGCVGMVLDLQGPDQKYLSSGWHRQFNY